LGANYYDKWKAANILDPVLDRLRAATRAAEGRKPTPTLGILDSQSVKTTEVAAETDFDAGKKVKGRKRHILADGCGLLLAVFVSSASVQDRDGAVPLIHAAHESFPSIEKILLDSAYVGEVINDWASATGITVEVTKRNEQVNGFVPVAKRWSAERTLGWLGRYRRTSKDYERSSETEEDRQLGHGSLATAQTCPGPSVGDAPVADPRLNSLSQGRDTSARLWQILTRSHLERVDHGVGWGLTARI
jgi:putative transposase